MIGTCVRHTRTALCAPPSARWLLVVAAFASGALFLTIETLVPTLMENHALTHEAAALLYGAYGALASLAALATAPAFDALPVAVPTAAALAAALALRVAAAVGVAMGGGARLLTGSAVLLLAVADVAWSTPLTLAVKRAIRYRARRGLVAIEAIAAEETRVFALLYMAQNAAAAATALAYETLRATRPALTEANTLALVLAAALTALAACAAAFAWPALRQQDGAHEHDAVLGAAAARAPVAPTCADVRAPALWRFAVVCTLLIGVRMLFRHNDATLPVVMQRAGDAHAHFPLVQALNPLLIMPLVPALQALTARHSAYGVIVAGAAVSAAAVGVLVVAPGGALWPYALYMALFSVGEALWSARFLAYAMSVAPAGREATYVALAALPTFAAKLPTALFSAWIVDAYCAAPGACDTARLWAWVLGAAAFSPLALAALGHWLDARTPPPLPSLAPGSRNERTR